MTNTSTVFKAYVTNLGSYNCGYLLGEWVSFPASDEELATALALIGCADGTEYFITDYESDFNINMGEYVSLDELNAVAEAIAELDEWDAEKLPAALELGHYSTIAETVENLDRFTLYSDVEDDYNLGYMYAVECGTIDPESTLAQYFDYEAYGRDTRLEEGGIFTDCGYIFAD